MVELLDVSASEWYAFLERHPAAGPFHHPRWAQLLAEVYGQQASAVVWRRSDGTIEAGLPVLVVRGRRERWVALPFTDHCPPVATRDLTADDLIEAAASASAAPAAFEVRADIPGAAEHENAGYRHDLPLAPTADEVRRRFHRDCSGSIRRAEREGVEVRRSVAEEALLDGFYSLHARTRRRLGVPVQPPGFFRSLHRLVFEEGLGFTLSAYKGERVIASAVFLAWNGSLVYKYSASDVAHRNLRGPNAVLWAAVSWACENGFESLDFGRTEAGNEGLRSFKRSWGGIEHPLVYTHIGDAAGVRSSSRLLRGVRPVIRHGPLWVGRALGRIGYRRAL